MIDISRYTKPQVLKALYDNAKPRGFGFLNYEPEPMTLEEAEECLKGGTYFDYLKGRVMKVELKGEEFSPGLYDRDNGAGAAKRAINTICLQEL